MKSYVPKKKVFKFCLIFSPKYFQITKQQIHFLVNLIKVSPALLKTSHYAMKQNWKQMPEILIATNFEKKTHFN